MKYALLLILLLQVLNGMGQTQAPVPTEPAYFLDSKPIDIKNVYINALSIDSIVVENKSATKEVHMKSKRPIEFLSLDQVLRLFTNIDDAVNPVVYLIGDQLITSKNGVKIDNSYYIYVKTIDLKDLTYIDKKYKNLVLVSITLSEDQLKPEVDAKDLLDILKQ